MWLERIGQRNRLDAGVGAQSHGPLRSEGETELGQCKERQTDGRTSVCGGRGSTARADGSAAWL